MTKGDFFSSLKRRSGALLLFAVFCALFQILFFGQSLLEGLYSSRPSLIMARHVGSAIMVFGLLVALTRQRIEWKPKAALIAFVAGMMLSTLVAILSQAQRWIAVAPEVSLSIPFDDIVYWLAVAASVALFEEVFFRRFLDQAFSAIIGSWLGAALQIGLFVSSHHPLASALPFDSTMERATFGIVATQLARCKLGLMAAIGVHFATNAIFWIGFGTHDRVASSISAQHPLSGAVGMLPDTDWKAFGLLSITIGYFWFVHPSLWDRPESFRFRWQLFRARHVRPSPVTLET